MKKNGFMFVESVTVLVVVILSLTLLLSSYSLVVRKSKEKNYYDLPSDKYLLYNIGNLGDTSAEYSASGIFVANVNNCSTYLSDRMSDCTQVFKDNNMIYFIFTPNLYNDLRTGASTRYSSGTIEYLKTLKRCNDATPGTCNNPIGYIVGVFYRSGKYYYASLKL